MTDRLQHEDNGQTLQPEEVLQKRNHIHQGTGNSEQHTEISGSKLNHPYLIPLMTPCYMKMTFLILLAQCNDA